MANSSDGKHNTSHNPAESRETAAGWRRVLLPELRDTLRRFDKTGSAGGNNTYESERNVEKILSSEQLTRDALSNIAVVAFIGQSGTGKSTRAIKVAGENEIYYIIDDGLLINGSRIVAGTSAKKAPTKIESVRQAIFVDPTRSEVMRRALVENMPKALMILGT